MKRIHIVDTTLRDGSHAVSHQFTLEQIKKVAEGLDNAGAEYIEITHGDGLSGSSYNYGFSLYSDKECLESAAPYIKNAKLTVLLLPGIGVKENLEEAKEAGAKVVRVATHVTEADIGEQHIALARKLGMEAFGFLMMSHMASKEKIIEQAKLFESYGADVVYVTDSAGAMIPQEVREKVQAVCDSVSIPVGFHAHNNLSLAVANSITAIESGATYVDSCLRGLGAGAGNTQTEVLVGVLEKLGYDTGVDFYKIMDVAEGILEPLMKRPQVINNASLVIGYAGVYSSFLLHAQKAAEKFKLDVRDILFELGKRKMVGGQEDMIVDVAYEMSRQKAGG
ncbi:MAG: 4-hydroxy-2-oxovalerate aldolase [Thermoplasmata archaeon]